MDQESKVSRRKVLGAAAAAAVGLTAATGSQAHEAGNDKDQPKKKKQKAPPLKDRERKLPEYKAELVLAEEFRKEYPNPIVLHFQPTDFAVLTDAEDLRLWEKTLREQVGLDVQAGAAIGIACETCTYNCSDACDQE